MLVELLSNEMGKSTLIDVHLTETEEHLSFDEIKSFKWHEKLQSMKLNLRKFTYR